MDYTINYILDNIGIMSRQILHTFILMLDKEQQADFHERVQEELDAGNITMSDDLSAELRYLNWSAGKSKEKESHFIRNPSINGLVQTYIMKVKGTVGSARKELRRRFSYCSYDEQVIIIHTFMTGACVNDIIWCTKYLIEEDFWRESYLPILWNLWHKHSDNYALSKAIIKYADEDTIRIMISILNPAVEFERRIRTQAVIRLAKDKAINLMDFNLNPRDYIYVAAKTGRKVAQETVLEGLLFLMSQLNCEFMVRNLLSVKVLDNGEVSFQLNDKHLMWAIAKLGCADALIEFNDWLTDVIKEAITMYSIKELNIESLNKAISDVIFKKFPENFGYLLYT